jgi:hypothetical protein
MVTAEFDRSIADRLGKGVSRDDLLLEICDRTGADWEGAEDYLSRLEIIHYKRINTRKNVLILLVSLAMLAEGSLQAGLGLFAVYPNFSAFFSHPDSTRAIDILMLLISPTGIFTLSGLALFGAGLAGIGMTLRNLAN